MQKTNPQAHYETVTQKELELAILTGQYATEDYPKAITKPGGGGKFTFDGSVLPFPGNTFICHVDPKSKAYQALCTLQEDIRNGPAGDYFAFLPPSSFHMTVFPALCGDPLGDDGWPEDIEAGTGLDAVTQIYTDRLKGKTAFESCRVAPQGLYAGYSLNVLGAREADRLALKSARDMLQDITALRRTDFDTYRYHISICYMRKWLPRDIAAAHLDYIAGVYEKIQPDISEIELGQVEFCIFDNMHAFRPIMKIPSS